MYDDYELTVFVDRFDFVKEPNISNRDIKATIYAETTEELDEKWEKVWKEYEGDTYLVHDTVTGLDVAYGVADSAYLNYVDTCIDDNHGNYDEESYSMDGITGDLM